MLRFKRLDCVKIKSEHLKNDLPLGPLIVSDIVKMEDCTREYVLTDLHTHRELIGIPDDWLEPALVREEKKTVSILGTTYTIVEKPLKDCDGYCDKTTKDIAIAVKDDDCELGNFEEYRKKVLRHEIIHAYHHESGLDNNFENKPYGFSETLVDWFAIQSPKIFETFKELNIL